MKANYATYFVNIIDYASYVFLDVVRVTSVLFRINIFIIISSAEFYMYLSDYACKCFYKIKRICTTNDTTKRRLQEIRKKDVPLLRLFQFRSLYSLLAF